MWFVTKCNKPNERINWSSITQKWGNKVTYFWHFKVTLCTQTLDKCRLRHLLVSFSMYLLSLANAFLLENIYKGKWILFCLNIEISIQMCLIRFEKKESFYFSFNSIYIESTVETVSFGAWYFVIFPHLRLSNLLLFTSRLFACVKCGDIKSFSFVYHTWSFHNANIIFRYLR